MVLLTNKYWPNGAGDFLVQIIHFGNVGLVVNMVWVDGGWMSHVAEVIGFQCGKLKRRKGRNYE